MSRHQKHKLVPQGKTKTFRVLANKHRAIKTRVNGLVVKRNAARRGK